MTFSYDGKNDILKNCSEQIAMHEKNVICGENGTGKSTLLKLLLGLYPGYQGEILINGKELGSLNPAKWREKCAFVEQVPFLFEGTVRENVKLGQEVSEKKVDQVLERVGIVHLADRRVGGEKSELSGGECQKIAIARALLRNAEVLILDEPTNHLDIASREWVEAAIEEFEGVLLFVSHDRYFIEKFAERIWLLEDGKIRDFPCGYQKYRSILEHEAAAKPAVSTAPKPKKERAKGGTKDAEKLVRRLEREIEKQEQVVADFDRQIEAAAADYQELTRLLGEKEEAEAALMDLMEQWEQAQA